MSPGELAHQALKEKLHSQLEQIQDLASVPASFSRRPRLQAAVSKHGNQLFALPATYMNQSGQAVAKVLRYYDEPKQVLAHKQLIVVHDDLDLELGSFKLQFGVGPRQHNGLLSIYQVLDSDQFWHLRLGIDSRQGERRMPPAKYVLEKWSKDDLIKLTGCFAPAVVQLLKSVT